MIDGYVKKWLIKANNDLKVAEHEMKLSQKDIVTEAICFHCQQAVEKFFKAYLITKNVEFGKTHNLEYLLELCIKKEKEFKEFDMGNLSFYAVEVRYPNEFYTPTKSEAQKCIKIAKNVRKYILSKLDPEEEVLQDT